MTPAERLTLADSLRLAHGEVRFVLWHMDCGGGEDEDSFDTALKNFRRLGVPFEAVGGRGVDASYGFGDLCELTLAFILRQQGLTARHAVPLLIDNRTMLRALMRQALAEATTGRGARVEVTVSPVQSSEERSGGIVETRQATGSSALAFPVDGAWLDFGLHLQRGLAPMAVTPELLSPAEALWRFTTRSDSLQRRPPVPASDITLRLLDLAGSAPRVRRGRPRHTSSGKSG